MHRKLSASGVHALDAADPFPPDLETLSESDPRLLSLRADRFFSARTFGPIETLERYLDVADSLAFRRRLLVEYVAIDLDRSWREGRPRFLEEYARRFDRLAGGAVFPDPELLVEEYRCRRHARDAADIDEYRTRFPHQFDAVRAHLIAARCEADCRDAPVPPPTGANRADPACGPLPHGYVGAAVLGRGTFAVVVRAANEAGIEKAVKAIQHPVQSDATQFELAAARLVMNLRHPFLLRPEDIRVEGDRAFLVYELAEMTLRERMRECVAAGGVGIPADDLQGYTRQAAHALDFAHGTGRVLHRDVKPDNLLLFGPAGCRVCRVGDFGLASVAEQAESISFAGSPAYMAPEGWSARYSAATDLYALAVTYAELRQGQLPVHTGQLCDVMCAHLEGRFEFRPDVFSAGELAVLRRALAKEPGRRFPTCVAFADALAAAFRAESGAA